MQKNCFLGIKWSMITDYLAIKKHFKVYFVGIGGVSMSALAVFLKAKGFCVCGYDKSQNDATAKLKSLGISVNKEEDIKSCDLAVVSSAIAEDNPVLIKLKQYGKPFIGRGQLLSELFSLYPKTIGIAGTHGKTTCTALTAHIFKRACMPFTAHIGGEDNLLGNMYLGGDEYFISEVCEYKQNINYITPFLGVVLNVDDDHLESYSSFDNLKQAFADYVGRSRVAVLNKDDALTVINKNKIYFSMLNKNADYYASEIECLNGKLSYVINEKGSPLCKINGQTGGTHDVYNALAATACARFYNIPPDCISEAISRFSGIKRRNEYMGKYKNIKVYADYCHHPKQIECTLKECKNKFKGKTAFIFQPHTYSRTKALFSKFINVLSGVENLFVFDTYAAREQYEYEGSAKALCFALPNACYAGDNANVKNILDYLSESFDCVVVLGAGNLYDSVKKIMGECF